MPAYAEMLVSQSPSVYSHPLSAADYKPGNPGPLPLPPLGDRSGNMGDSGVVPYYGGSATPRMHNYCRPASLQLPSPHPPASGHAPLQRQLTPPCLSPTGSGKGPSSPLRSCLVMRPEDLTASEAPTLIGDNSTIAMAMTTASTAAGPADTRTGLGAATEASDVTAAEAAARNKKKVVFADDQGGQLTQVRVMREPSYMPPIWSLQFLAHVTQGMISPVPQEQWVVDFVQPASDYVRFRQKLDDRNISLENVIIKETEQLIVGTVKVKNLSYHKEVILRSSCDNWKTHEDTFCTYSLVGNGAASAYLIFDTFSFKVTLPPKSRRIEFCACFKCDGVEYWDNNDGRNYSLTNRIAPRQDSGDFLPSSGAGAFGAGAGRNGGTATAASGFSSPYMAPGAVLDTWSDMSAETQSGPYCKAYGCVVDRTGSDVMAPKQQQPYCEATATTTPPAMRPIEMELSAGGGDGGCGRVRTSSSSPHNSGPWLGERRASTGEEFALLANNNQSGRPERPPQSDTTATLGRSASSGKLFFIRERNEGEDLLANLLRLRKLMCSQKT
ncbi:uncharacterized protein LOC131212275 [Anopheles bellator]|uniref:uncharacterized protein LOC131212275 n=1 Tax=Anopheles bellator TaxID=139047 RepID=UPI0026480B2C|nr:uncharacterized protein LOC131212275 [Anopheles bellator]